MTNATNPTGWFYNLYTHFWNETDSNLHSRMAIDFLFANGASIAVLNIPIYMIISQMFNVCIHDQHDPSRTLTNAN